MSNEELIEHLRSEVKRVKNQRNEIEQDLFKAHKRIRELVWQSNDLHAELKKLKKYLDTHHPLKYITMDNPNDIEIIQESYQTDAEAIKHLEGVVVGQHNYIIELESKVKTLQELNSVLMCIKPDIQY